MITGQDIFTYDFHLADHSGLAVIDIIERVLEVHVAVGTVVGQGQHAAGLFAEYAGIEAAVHLEGR